MSVINSVLKDLEKRPGSFTPLDMDTLETDKNSKLLSWVIWSAGVLICLSAVYATYSQDLLNKVFPPASSVQQDQRGNPVQSATVVEEPAVLSSKSMAPATIDPPANSNSIVGLQINETQEFMELEFQLLEKAQIFLLESARNRYVFFVNEAGNQIKTPVISDNLWLQSIQLSSNEEGVQIQFETQPGVLSETLHTEKEDFHYWTLRLKSSAITEEKSLIQPPNDNTVEKLQNKLVKAGEKKKPALKPAIKPPTVNAEQVRLDIKPATKLQSSSEKLKVARNLVNRKQYQLAEQHLTGLFSSDVDRLARIHLIDALTKQNKKQQTSLLINESLEKYPADDVFKRLHAKKLFDEKRYVELTDKFSEESGDIQLLNLIAASYQRINEHDKAIGYFKKALDIDHTQAKLWISLAISQQHESHNEGALDSYKMAMRSGQMNERLHSFVEQRTRQLSNMLGNGAN